MRTEGTVTGALNLATQKSLGPDSLFLLEKKLIGERPREN